MSALIQYKYITLLSGKLEGFKQKGTNTFNFRCPLCGDSEKNKNKKRGYFFVKDNEYLFHCFNCGVSKTLKSFLYDVDPELYKQYKKDLAFENMQGSHSKEQDNTAELCTKQSKKIYFNEADNRFLTRISELPSSHDAVKYLQKRKVPEKSFSSVFWTDNFKGLIEQCFKDTYRDTVLPTSGIVFEICSFEKEHPVIGYQIRTIDPNAPKQLRFKICKDETVKGAFGANKLDLTQQIYVVEGAIDSLFLPNCIAVMSASLWRIGKNEGIKNAIYINDCEPRNRSVVAQIKNAVDKGLRVTLLPNMYNSLDINDIICKYNLNESELVELINRHTYSGLSAKVKLANWRLS